MKIFMFFLLFFASPPLFAQATFKVMTYNVENFFDTRDNPTNNDAFYGKVDCLLEEVEELIDNFNNLD